MADAAGTADDLALEIAQVRGVAAETGRALRQIRKGQIVPGLVAATGLDVNEAGNGLAGHPPGHHGVAGEGGAEIDPAAELGAEHVLGVVAAKLADIPCRRAEQLVLWETGRVKGILALYDQVEALEGERIQLVREKFDKALADLAAKPDPSRLEQEMIFYLEKYDINEEKVRLRQHCKYFMEVIDSDPFPGKKLGFIIQEMGREINTTGSKANHAGIQQLVVRMKDELEKIKEQSMNIL